MDVVPHLLPVIANSTPITVRYGEPPRDTKPPLVIVLINGEPQRLSTLADLGTTAHYDVSVFVYGKDYSQTADIAHQIQEGIEGYSNSVINLIEPDGWADEPAGKWNVVRQLNYIVIYTEPIYFNGSGGVRVSSTATVKATYRHSPSGGAKCAGVSIVGRVRNGIEDYGDGPGLPGGIEGD